MSAVVFHTTVKFCLFQLSFLQLTKDIDALRAQVTSLLGELKERQTCLEKCEEERRRLDEK